MMIVLKRTYVSINLIVYVKKITSMSRIIYKNIKIANFLAFFVSIEKKKNKKTKKNALF